MGYFANGTEGQMYEEKYCNRCIHGDDCPIWALHLRHNYDQQKDDRLRSVLNELIPRDGIHNGECTMFIAESP